MHNQDRRSRRRLAAIAVASIAFAGLAACSSSGNGSTGDNSPAATNTTPAANTPAETTPAGQSTPPASGAEPNTLTVTGYDYKFDFAGSPHAGLVTITFDNKGKYAHEIGLARVKDGVTLDQVTAALMSSDPDAEAKAKQLQVDPDTELSAPAILGPGLSEVTAVTLPAGHYVVTCFLPGPDGMPHVAMGMIGEFTVAAASGDVAPPQTAGTVELTDSGITVPDGLGTGGVYEVKNTGSAPHDFSVAKLNGAQLLDYFQCVSGSFGSGTPIDNCPGMLVGGVSYLAPGASAYLALTLPAGDYNYVSTEGDGADFQAGLAGSFTVK
jgi:hypothetical protein